MTHTCAYCHATRHERDMSYVGRFRAWFCRVKACADRYGRYT